MATLIIGLGNIGAEIAARIHTATPVIGADLSAERREDFHRRTGAPTVASAADAPWGEVDRAIVIVRSSAAVLKVAAEVRKAAQVPLACHVMTTLAYEDAARLAKLSTTEFRLLEQPVSGGASGAASGGLTIYSAGPAAPSDLDFLRTHLATTLVEFREYAQPTLAKLINNAAAAYHLAVHAWALGEATRRNIDGPAMHDLLQRSSGASAIAALVPEMGPDQGALLAKDVALLVDAVGELPSLGTSSTETALARLHAFLDDATSS